MLKKITLLLFATVLTACSADIEIHSPEDGIISLCNTGSLSNTRVSCITPGERIASYAQGNTALVVYIEPGDYNSNLAIADESVRVVANSIPNEYANIKPYLRQIMINLAVSHIRYLVTTYGSRYDHIYIFRSDTVWTPSAITLALKNVLTYNKTVDLMLQVHGNPGSLALNSTLTNRLTVADINNMKNTLSVTQRDRVRSIFNTACYSAVYGNYGGIYSSVAQSLVNVFPRATTYGDYGVNYGAIHRDAVAFENYYARGWDFYYSAGSFSNTVMTRTIASSYTATRTTLPFPLFSIRGVARYVGMTKTEWQTIKLPALSFTGYQHDSSRAYLHYGSASANSTISTRFADRTAETDLRLPSSYLAPSSCLVEGKFLPHGYTNKEYVYTWNFDTYPRQQISKIYSVSCIDGRYSKTDITPPPPPPEYGGGY